MRGELVEDIRRLKERETPTTGKKALMKEELAKEDNY